MVFSSSICVTADENRECCPKLNLNLFNNGIFIKIRSR